MRFPSTCFAGRIVIRHDLLGGLDWTRPCVVPAENELPMVPPMYFCSPHYGVLADSLAEMFDRVGLLDQGIVTGPLDDFDALMQQHAEGE